MLEQQQQERDDGSFHRLCMFCSEEFTGNRFDTDVKTHTHPVHKDPTRLSVTFKADISYVLLLPVSRSSLLNHMAREHSFSIGLPDNIVYCNDFMDALQSKLDKYGLTCD